MIFKGKPSSALQTILEALLFTSRYCVYKIEGVSSRFVAGWDMGFYGILCGLLFLIVICSNRSRRASQNEKTRKRECTDYERAGVSHAGGKGSGPC